MIHLSYDGTNGDNGFNGTSRVIGTNGIIEWRMGDVSSAFHTWYGTLKSMTPLESLVPLASLTPMVSMKPMDRQYFH